MWTRQHKKRKSGALVVPLIAAAFLSYFGFHAWHGQYGIYSKYAFEARAEELRADLATIRKDRERLEHRVRLLRDGTIEKDMLDEHARSALNLARSDEIIILRDRRASN